MFGVEGDYFPRSVVLGSGGAHYLVTCSKYTHKKPSAEKATPLSALDTKTK